MGKLVLLRHGQSIYNKENLFTGWTDVDLSEEGREEAQKAGKILYKNSLFPDICFTSWLKRAIHTAQIALREMVWEHTDCIKSWKLNERHYGAWQQHNKDAIRKEVGEKAFLAVRRGYATPPPPLQPGDPRLPHNDPKYAALDRSLLPRSESLRDTQIRTLNYFHEAIVPWLAKDATVLVSAHGNSLRALVMAIEKLTPQEIVNVEIPTGVPIVYRFDAMIEMIEKEMLR